MLHCKSSCELREKLRSEESRVNKLKQVLDWLDDLRFYQPHRHREVEMKTVNEKIEYSLTEARQLLVRIDTGEKNVTKSKNRKRCSKTPQTLSHETVSPPTTSQPHPMGTVSKTEEKRECLMPISFRRSKSFVYIIT